MKLRLLTVGLLGLCAFASAAGLIDNKNQASISSGADKPENAKKPKVLIIIGDATELLDTMYPVYRLQEAGFQPVFATPEKRVYQTVLHEVKPGWTITKEWEGYTINSDIAFKDIKPEEYAGIFFSGGRAPEYIREDEALLAATRWFWENKKPMMSVCHGVEIPARAGIVKGLRMATVPKCKMAFSSTPRSSSIATWSAAAPSMITVRSSARGSRCSKPSATRNKHHAFPSRLPPLRRPRRCRRRRRTCSSGSERGALPPPLRPLLCHVRLRAARRDPARGRQDRQ